MSLISMWKWFLDLFRSNEVEHPGATDDWSPKKALPPPGPLPEEIERREALARERALIDSQPIPLFEDTWDNLVERGVLTGVGADVDADFREWTRDDLTLERIADALKKSDDDTTDDLKISV